jgi:pimeloyl-ACP methyl ester carboxylesterase
MTSPNQPKHAHPSIGRGRKLFLWLGGTVVALLVLLIMGVVYERLSEAADARAYPPPGKMVDVGGYRLHLNCAGSGSPTVVIDAGYGDWSASWGWVQSGVAKTTHICTYDRAGMGWSEASPSPRTAREFAKELHTLLTNANEPGPYVLVGHSMGGNTVRVYAHDYPAEVSGLVLIDAQKMPAADAAKPQAAPKPGKNSLPALLARAGFFRLLAGPLGLNQEVPEQYQQAYLAYSVTPRSAQTAVDEGMGMAEGGWQARAVTTLGDLPLIVLSRGKDQSADWTASQASYLQLSTRSQQFFADKSGHLIQIEQPEAAAAAILKMVEQLRK